jgi:hypothetical protein
MAGEKELEMDNNIAVNRYLKDEYVNIIDANHQFAKWEQKSLINDLWSSLKLTAHRNNKSGKNRRNFWQFWHRTSLDNSVVQAQIHRIPRTLPRT